MKEKTSNLFNYCGEKDYYVLASQNKTKEVFSIQLIDEYEEDFEEVLSQIEKENFDYCYGDYDYFTVEYGKVIFKEPVEVCLGNVKRYNKETKKTELSHKTILVKEFIGYIYPECYYKRKSNKPCDIEFLIEVEQFIEYDNE